MTSPKIQSAPPYAAPTSLKRDVTIDVIRGFCIVSMVTAHLAGFSLLASALHIVPKFDGASGFVLLGGLVLGMVQSRRVRTSGLAAVQRKSAKRVAVIYGAQAALVFLGVVAALGGWDSTNFPDMRTLSGGEIITHSMMMTLAPPGGDVLRLYVFMLALAMGAYLLLARNRWVLVLALSAAIHIVGQVFPALTSFSPFADQAPSAGWAGWQLLFISALVLGWYWKDLDVAGWLDRNAWRVFAASVAVVAIAAGVSILASETWDEILFSKYTFSIGRIFVAYAAIAAMYVALRWLMRRFPRLWVRPLAMIGARSLDSYIIQSVMVVLVFGFTMIDAESILAQLIAIGTLALCWGWAEIRAGAKFRQREDTSKLTA